MKKLLAGAAALSLMAPAFAHAASTSADIKLNSTVAPACGVGGHISGASAAPGWDQNDITVDLANGGVGFGGATFANRSLGNVWCNSVATVSFTVEPLKTSATTTDTDSFANSFDVKVTTDAAVYWGGHAGDVVQTAGSPVTVTGTSNGAFETGLQRYSGMTIDVLKAPGSGGNGKRAVAGTYASTITFTASTN